LLHKTYAKSPAFESFVSRKMYKYKAKGTCAREISFDLREGKVHDVSFVWGCSGNLKALGILAEGMDAGELVAKLSGLTCGIRKTSCGDQLAKAVAGALAGSGSEVGVDSEANSDTDPIEQDK